MMRLLKLVCRNRLLIYSQAASSLLALLLLLNFVGWAAASYGFNAGFELSEKQYEAVRFAEGSAINFTHEANTYELLNKEYTTLGLFSLALITISMFEKFRLRGYLFLFVSAAHMVLMLVVLSHLRWLVNLKDSNMNESLQSSYNSLVRQSLAYDWGCIFVALTLILLQMAASYLWFLNRKSISDVP